MFLLVFALSEGGIYGWWTPIKDFTIAGHVVWPATVPISIIPLVFAVAIAHPRRVLLRRARARNGATATRCSSSRTCEFKTYRYGLLTGLVLAMGQLGLSFVLPVFLQDAKHLSRGENGLWHAADRHVRHRRRAGRRPADPPVGTTIVVRLGLVSYALGVLADPARDLARHHRAGSCCPASRSTASASASPARS